ncbi:sensor histidine kinase [Cypionkella psychrotolerans]|uniref:sensor histidine kinase n=1 Tax=Cypionkella psychrotolerans TaxID=1678131 RepID=UPI001F358D64|nr:ATP-binding protein [Cypionkella psychrotolerans]
MNRALARFILASAALGLLALVFYFGQASTVSRLGEQATAAADSRGQALESVLATQRAVAAILSDDGLVKDALRLGSTSAQQGVSRKLDQLRAETGSNVIYLLNTSGTAIAASNWDEPVSFVGTSYSFRRYFTDAMAKGTALEFALGTVSKRPGLYLSHVVSDGAAAVGVVVVKMEFDALEASWARSPDQTRVTDSTGIVLLSSASDERFKPMPRLQDRLNMTRPVPGVPDWTLTLSTSIAPARQAGVLAAGAALGFEIILGALIWRAGRAKRRAQNAVATERRYTADLQRAVEDRTRDLTAEMAERRAAEARLARMQADLVQANKLATLGQVTAGLAHEVNQPLATIRLLAENALALQNTAPNEVTENLGKIVRMSERIGQITTHLRGFARKATGQVGSISVKEAIDASVMLTASRRRVEGARLVIEGASPDLLVRAEAVRLEQVLVNLIQNAQEALAGRPDPEIRITVSADATHVTISIADNGPGLRPDIAAQLFTPFATSKPDGLGLGLVIAQDIVRDLGNELTADPPLPDQGATFRIRLTRA